MVQYFEVQVCITIIHKPLFKNKNKDNFFLMCGLPFKRVINKILNLCYDWLTSIMVYILGCTNTYPNWQLHLIIFFCQLEITISTFCTSFSVKGNISNLLSNFPDFYPAWLYNINVLYWYSQHIWLEYLPQLPHQALEFVCHLALCKKRTKQNGIVKHLFLVKWANKSYTRWLLNHNFVINA